MLKEIAGIEIEGANFTELKQLDFMKCGENRRRVSIIYGRNGTGKSTISRAFNFVKGDEEKGILQVHLRDNDGNCIELSDKEKENIHVFNEDYIDKKIKFQEDGINTIVLLGKKKELSEKVEKKEKEIADRRRVYDFEKEKVEEYKNVNNEKSPQYYIEVMKAALKGENNWSGRDAKINDKRVLTQVKSDTYKKIISGGRPTKSRDELIIDYKEKMAEFLQAKSGNSVIMDPVRTRIERNFKEDVCIELLGQKIEKPQLSEREKYIFKIFLQIRIGG